MISFVCTGAKREASVYLSDDPDRVANALETWHIALAVASGAAAPG